MKKTYFNALYAMICAGLALVVAACGGKDDAAADFKTLGAADDVMLLTGNVSDIMRNAGCVAGKDGIQLTPALTKILETCVSSAREKEEFENSLKLRGVDYRNCFVKVTKTHDIVFAFGLTDAKAFRQWMTQDMGIDSPVIDGEYQVYNLDKEVKLFTTEAAAYLVYRGRGVCDVAFLNELKEKAAANPLASWQVDALGRNKTCVMLLNAREIYKNVDDDQIRAIGGAAYSGFQALKNGYLQIEAQLKGMKLHVALTCLDADGNAIAPDIKFKDIDLKIFDYINRDDIMAVAVNLGGVVDWEEIFEAFDKQFGGEMSRGTNKLMANKIIEVLNAIDGTMFVSAHPKDLMRMSQGLQYWNGTIGAKMKKGAAEQYINELTSLASSFGLHPATQDGATVISLDPYTIYLKDVDGMLLISTQPITGKGGTKLVESYFKGTPCALEATLAEGTDFGAGPLPFQPVIAMSTTGNGVAFDVELVGDGEYLLDTLFTFIAAQIR